MKRILFILLLLPFFVMAQTGPKPGVKKPATTAAKKPAATPAKKSASTVKKPATSAVKKPLPGPKKANPQVVKLTEKAYGLYKESKDAQCEKVIKQILALEPKNKDAYLLRANIAMFANKFEDMWKYLDKLYKFYPKEPEIYSQFAMTHLNYYFLSDSAKRVLCRKTIKLGSRLAEGYASLGMVVAVGGYYQEAIDYFDISFTKTWKDSTSRVIINLPYARCLYETGDTLGAVQRLDKLIPRMGGQDKYTCVFLRAKYKLDLKDYNIKDDIDTLNSFAPKQPEIMILTTKYLVHTDKDSACRLAKKVRSSGGGETFDVSLYCSDLQKTIDPAKYKTYTYSLGSNDFVVNIDEFHYPESIKFDWNRGNSLVKTGWESGNVAIHRTALDSALMQNNLFANNSSLVLDKVITIWLSHLQYTQLNKDSLTKVGVSDDKLTEFKHIGHEQLEIFDENDKEILIDCLVISDGINKICYLDDPKNPMILKMELESFSIVLSKIE